MTIGCSMWPVECSQGNCDKHHDIQYNEFKKENKIQDFIYNINSIDNKLGVFKAILSDISVNKSIQPCLSYGSGQTRLKNNISRLPLASLKKVLSYLPFISGRGMYICLSNLPGLRRAWSNMSTLFVAAITTIPLVVWKPKNINEPRID